MERGLLKATNFRNNKNKLAYMYLLTPKGLEEKASVTLCFLKQQVRQYEALQLEIEEIRRDLGRRNKDHNE